MFNKNNAKVNKTELNNLVINTVVDENITVKGDIIGEGSIRIDGKIDGNIDLTQAIVLGEKGTISGTIKSDTIIIHGKLFGNLSCKQLFIKSTGVIDGDIEVEAFEVEMGGQYNGNLKMKNAQYKDEKIIKLAEGKK